MEAGGRGGVVLLTLGSEAVKLTSTRLPGTVFAPL